MATGGNSSEICSICTDKFKTPKLLPCFHTFCVDCLEQFVSTSSKNGQFLCPMCRYEVTLPEEGVTGFQTNVYIEARTEKEIHGSGKNCVLCEQCASHMCHECKLLLCDTCTKGHKLIPSTRAHLLINLNDSDSGKSVLSVQRFCEKHVDEKVRFYCKPCSKVICRDCKLTEHEGHKTTDICDVVEEARTGLLKTKVKLKTYKTEIEQKLEHLARNHTDTLGAIDTSKTEVNTFADSVGELISNARQLHITRLTDIEETQNKLFSQEQEVLSQRKCFIQSQIDHTDVMLNEGLDCDILTTCSEMKQRLNELEEEHTIFSNSDCQVLNIPPTNIVNSNQLSVVNRCVNDIFKCAFPVPYPVVPLIVTRRVVYKRKTIHSISFTNTSNIWLSRGDTSNELCLIQIVCQKPVGMLYTLSPTLDDLKKDGIHGFIHVYNEAEENSVKVPVTEYNNLKKGFLYKDTNVDGDTCKVDHEFDVVIIKFVDGDCRILNINPFSETGQQFKPVDVCWGDNQEVYIVDRGSQMIIVYSLLDGFQKAYLCAAVDGLLNPTAIAMDNEGNLWVGDDSGRIHVCSV